MWYTYRILLSQEKGQVMPSAATWTGLEVVTLSDVSQPEKDKHHMIDTIFKRNL